MAVENSFSTVRRVLYAQVLMATIVASGFLLMGGWKSAMSPLIGGGVALIPNLYFAYKVYLARYRDASGILKAFYAGETVKLLLTAALFAMVLQIPWINFLTLLVGYIAVLSVFWFALFYWRG
ncbi:ATP synthase subunit I [Methylomonas koyamae]|uniref:F0F1 ATP synthase assembly protein I n=1 Tax=Methylomonas koyamae TaxID=702114 RepID=A0A291IDZ5_9GAMM|nr:ATP synthase subunit I [Methylomonas koyamae]ATG88409.1 F0F1 ATP synthase assembly protein I [Methylomonas koyamae]OAI26408.1 F0F1 ATP synthase assembly protein I [Methylomonas koyamae]WNB76076.1 ATP synthase subunit I [Methylomonas koyamae]